MMSNMEGAINQTWKLDKIATILYTKNAVPRYDETTLPTPTYTL